MVGEVRELFGLHEIRLYAWIIKVGNRRYIISGTAADARKAKDFVERMPVNAGSTVTIKKVV
jgi:hypothetical protein